MRLDDIRRLDLLEGLGSDGAITFAGRRALLLDADALGLLRAQLVELLGATAARAVLTRFGHAHGWQTAEAVRHAIPWDDLREWKRAGGVLHRLQGLVDHRPTKRSDPRNRAEARWHRSYEAQQHERHFGTATEAVCWTLTAFVSGYLSRALERDVFAVETRCRGAGHAHCHVIARAREDWGTQIEEIEPWYEAGSLQAALGVLRERLVAEESRWAARRRAWEAADDDQGDALIARSATTQRALDRALRVAPHDVAVLLTGESGTGRESLARRIHAHGPRAQDPFLVVRCGSWPTPLLGSELFGHADGALDGAGPARPGLFEAAAGGTLFLDEVDALPSALQVRLLDVLRDGAVRRAGEDTPRPVDVRIVAASDRDLDALAAEGAFRDDLLHALKGVEIALAPLRERRADVLPLARHFLDRSRERLDRSEVQGFDAAVQRAFAEYEWPGNVRELESAVEHAVAIAAADLITVDDLPDGIAAGRTAAGTGPDSSPAPRPVTEQEPTADPEPTPDPEPGGPSAGSTPETSVLATLAEVEREHILRVLDAVGGNRSEAARRLGIGTATIYRRLRQYDVPP
ncbi:MAG TPA: sigma 54-interacting transcriptional regulator [Candidatus Krumholzibacteria bacterium]|nr:sigma 54-interacting transcriptional regulator [Candidatus Krumholzibacteria bacterium]